MDGQIARRIAGLAAAAALAVFLAAVSGSTLALGAPAVLDLTVNSPADLPDVTQGDGACETAPSNQVCTLRGAIQEANMHAGADTIHLQPNTTYVLDRGGDDNTALRGDLDITDSVTLLGAGPNSTIIDGSGLAPADRIFQITGTVVISGVTIEHGSSTGGGGVLNSGRLTLINSVVMSNSVGAPMPGAAASTAAAR